VRIDFIYLLNYENIVSNCQIVKSKFELLKTNQSQQELKELRTKIAKKIQRMRTNLDSLVIATIDRHAEVQVFKKREEI